MLPRQEDDTFGRVHRNLLILVRVEFDPVHRHRLRQGRLDDHGDDGAIFSLVSPVPQRDSLQFRLRANRDNVLIVG